MAKGPFQVGQVAVFLLLRTCAMKGDSYYISIEVINLHGHIPNPMQEDDSYAEQTEYINWRMIIAFA